MASVDIDWSQPVATLLKAGAAAAHDSTEGSEGAGLLIRAELDKDEYVRFLMMLCHVYDILERALDRRAAHPVLAPTHNPALLARTPHIAADIAHLLDVPGDPESWQAHPMHAALLSAPPAPYVRYTDRLQHLAAAAIDADANDADADTNDARLLAHAYVRYLCDPRRQAAKAYGLADGAGVSLFDFARLDDSGPSSAGDMKRVEEWFRDGMNAGVGDGLELKKAVVDEANLAFELNAGLFSVLRAPTADRSDGSEKPAAPVTEDTPSQERGELEHTSRWDKPFELSLSSFFTLVAVWCLPHLLFLLCVWAYFMLFDGTCSKWHAAQQWLSGLLPASL